MTSDASVVDVSRDWAIACDVQQRFMQGLDRANDTLDYSARCRQVRALGGDCYDFVPLPDHRLALAVGDASGKSLAAAPMISNVQSSLRTAALFTGNDGAAMLRAVNRQVHASSLADRYAIILWRFRRSNARAALRECGPQSPDGRSTRQLGPLA